MNGGGFLIFFFFFFFSFFVSVPFFLSKALEIFLFIYDTPVCGSTDYRSTCLAAMIDEQGAVKVTSLQVYLEKKETQIYLLCVVYKVYKIYIPDVLNKMLWTLPSMF